MSRGHFQLIASTIRLLPSFDCYKDDKTFGFTEVVLFDAICSSFADAPRGTNLNFKRERFLDACKNTKAA